MKTKLGVGIPTYKRYDLLEPTLQNYFADFSHCHIYIVDNGHQNIFAEGMNTRQLWQAKNKNHSFEGITLIENEVNVGVGASWNQLCKKIFEKNDYALILNDDIYLGKSDERISELIERKKPAFIRSTPDWCAFIIHKSAYEQIGPFDECFFPAYYEDRSYEYRMRLKGIPIIKHPELNPLIYRSSMTIEKEPSIIEHAKKNKRLYVDMWGGEPGKEKFSQPFNHYKKNKNEVL